MVLYAANLAELGQPVKKGKKVAEPEEVIPKEKKAPTEKQLAALAKAQETRKRKREEAEQAKEEAKKAIENEAKEQADKEAAKAAKKQAAKEKREAAKKAKLETPPQTDDTGSFNEAEVSKEIDEALEAVKPIKIGKPRAKKVKDETEPPEWFKKYAQGVKNEEQMFSKEKKPKKQVRHEADEIAKEAWNDPLTKGRVINELDNHASRMYSMMFAGRRLK